MPVVFNSSDRTSLIRHPDEAGRAQRIVRRGRPEDAEMHSGALKVLRTGCRGGVLYGKFNAALLSFARLMHSV